MCHGEWGLSASVYWGTKAQRLRDVQDEGEDKGRAARGGRADPAGTAVWGSSGPRVHPQGPEPCQRGGAAGGMGPGGAWGQGRPLCSAFPSQG